MVWTFGSPLKLICRNPTLEMVVLGGGAFEGWLWYLKSGAPRSESNALTWDRQTDDRQADRENPGGLVCPFTLREDSEKIPSRRWGIFTRHQVSQHPWSWNFPPQNSQESIPVADKSSCLWHFIPRTRMCSDALLSVWTLMLSFTCSSLGQGWRLSSWLNQEIKDF